MSFGLEDHEWVDPEIKPEPIFCADCKHCQEVNSGVDWYYCDIDANLSLKDAKTPEQVLRAFTDAWIDLEDSIGCQYFE